MRSRTRVLAAIAAVVPWSGLRAQAAASPAPITPIVALRVRPELWDWFRAGGDDGRYAFLGVHARAGLAQQRTRWGWRVELAAPVLLGLPTTALAPAPRGQLGLGAAYYAANDSATNAAGVFLKQGFVRLGAPPSAGGHSLRLGRFEFADGAETVPANPTAAAVKRDRAAQRMIGPFGFTHAQRSFDGAHYAFDRAGRNATVLLVRPTRGAFDVHGWDELDVTLGYGSLTFPVRTRRLVGDARLFAAYYRDERDAAGVVKTDNRPSGARSADRAPLSLATVGAHWVEAVRTGIGEVDVLLWGAAQTGDWGAQSHRGHAAAAEVGWQPGWPASLRPWLRTGWYVASGDDDPADGRHGTFFSMLPTARAYARFPFYTLMNVEDIFASLLLRPAPAVTVRLDARHLRLASANDLWYSGGGAFEPNSFGYAGRPANGRRQLGTLLDLSADWRLAPRWSVGLYAATVNGGAVVERIYPARPNASFGYVELQYSR